MARKSRKNIFCGQIKLENTTASPIQEEKKVLVGIYARLSIFDSGNPGSETMENQILLLKHYVAADSRMVLVDIYCDNGTSGTNFERPAFQRLLQDTEIGKINCIVVKDLSRLGRNFIEAGNYLERIFPARGIRFISVTEQLDSQEIGYLSVFLAVKNLMNEFYAKDISQKTISSLRMKQQEGKFLSGRTPYGYLRNSENKYLLQRDKEAAPIVKRIFLDRAAGKSMLAIARELNDQGVLPPERYRYERGLIPSCRNLKSLWGERTVHFILVNPIYCGKLAYGKTEKQNFKEKRGVPQEESKWRIIIAKHEAIISEALFLQVKEKIAENKKRKEK